MKLKDKLCYLVGPMDRTKDGATWRFAVQYWLEQKGVRVFNPYTKPIDIGLEDFDRVALREKYIQEENWDAVSEIMKEIVWVDLRMVDKSDFIVCYFNIDEKPVGTLDELIMANSQKKPILIMMEGGKKNTPRWMFGRFDHNFIFNSWFEIYDYLNRVDSGEITSKRWKHFRV